MKEAAKAVTKFQSKGKMGNIVRDLTFSCQYVLFLLKVGNVSNRQSPPLNILT